ncbi:transposase (plasmid) [Pseudomonas cerasi]|nr:transposase [Pseudomonas cerasi]
MLVHIRAIHARSRGSYGWPRIWRGLLADGVRVGKPTGLHADRYEFWLYRQIRKRLNEKADTLAQMDIPFLRQPVDAQLDALTRELRAQLLAFNRELKRGKLTHLTYDKDAKTLIWHKPKGENQKVREQSFYEQLPYCDVADVFRFVNGQWSMVNAIFCPR